LTAGWELLVGEGSQALLEGRFRECERLASLAAQLAPTEPSPPLLAAIACREQGRSSEAEVLVRSLLGRHPDVSEGQALLGAVLADLGRDGEARRQLDLVTGGDPSPAVLALGAEIASALDSPEHAGALVGPLADHAGTVAGGHGSLSRHLGQVCHVLGRWDEAEEHFQVALDVNHAAGAPVVVAHTLRHYSALLRARGGDGDWEKAIDLLAQAASVYRRLEIERLAEEAEAVLRRSQGPTAADPPPDAAQVFRRTAGGWELAYGGESAVVADAPGLAHIATLLGNGGRPVHVVDLVDTPTATPERGVVEEYRSQLAEVDGRTGAADPAAAALARAERDLLAAELAARAGLAGLGEVGVPAEGGLSSIDAGDRARRLVALRIRTSLDLLDLALPALGRHLRRSVRTGTFCLYEPGRPERWTLG